MATNEREGSPPPALRLEPRKAIITSVEIPLEIRALLDAEQRRRIASRTTATYKAIILECISAHLRIPASLRTRLIIAAVLAERGILEGTLKQRVAIVDEAVERTWGHLLPPGAAEQLAALEEELGPRT